MAAKEAYSRSVTPDSDLNRACPKCGHVTKAFHPRCPICGRAFGKSTGWKWFVLLILLASIAAVLVAAVRMSG
jgi:RNA polymerase subunit RPABC4/transcription elongation factor Spt4